MRRPVGAWVVVLAALAVGCSQRPLTAYPSTLGGHARAFAATGRATVPVLGEDRPAVVDGDTQVVVEVPDAGGALARQVTIAELVAGCDAPASPVPAAPVVPAAPAAPVAPAATCLADRVVPRALVVGHRQERHVGRVATSIATGTFVVGVGAICVAKCDGEKVAAGVGIGVAVIALAVFAFSR